MESKSSGFKIHLVAGARPNFIKIAPLYFELQSNSALQVEIVHTGQHYDTQLNQNIWDDLGLPTPHHFLEVGEGTPSAQTANILNRYGTILKDTKPSLVVVVGDVTSTFAATLVAKQMGIRVAHVEAGLRSFDLTMPEEMNRLLTDAICDFHWTPSEDANQNLYKEGRNPKNIKLVGNIMIDSLVRNEARIEEDTILSKLNLEPKSYTLMTFHRPSNVDDPKVLENVVRVAEKLSKTGPVVFPLHPRTRKRLEEFGIRINETESLKLIAPLGYLAFSKLLKYAKFVVTDSGGVQEETSFRSVPCFTVRDSTERPVTITKGTNRLIKLEQLEAQLGDVSCSKLVAIPFWDGKTASRIHTEIKKLL